MTKVLLLAALGAVSAQYDDDVRILTVSGYEEGLNLTGSNCHLFPYHGERVAKDRNGVGCIGGQGGDYFAGHKYNEAVKSMTLWAYGADHDGASALAWELTDDTDFFRGTMRKQSCSFTFEPGDRLVGDIGLHGNGHGTRLGRVEFAVRRGATGKIESYGCGHSHTRYSMHADGYVIAGFFGAAKADIDMLGVIIKKPDCSVQSREITDIKCVTPIAGDNNRCSAVWTDAGETATAHAICDFCSSSNGGACSAEFTMSETHEISTTSSSIDQLGGSVTIGEEVGMEFLGEGGKITDSFTVTYSHSWQHSKTQSSTTSHQISSTCSVNMAAHSKTIFDALQHVGHMTADIEMTVTSKDKCGGTKKENHRGRVSISKVPITAAISECEPHDAPCSALLV